MSASSNTRNKVTLLLFLAGLALLTTACHTLPGIRDNSATEHAGMSLLDRNPWVARQRTRTGRRIQAVEYLDGQVYVGFGDWRANTGPIAVTSWDVAHGEWIFHFRAGTEAIERFRPLSSGLLLPYTDPTRAADFARGPVWQEARASEGPEERFYHVFDAVETAAGLFLIGTRRNTAEAQVLRWDGQHWQESLVLSGKPDWIWFVAVLDDALVIQSETQGSFRYEDGNWSQTQALFDKPRTRAVVSVDGRAAGISREATRAGHLQVSNGSERSHESEANALDLNIDQSSGWVYLLRSDRIERSRDLLTWETLSIPVPAGATALDVGEGYAWVGTADSRLWAVRLPGG